MPTFVTIGRRLLNPEHIAFVEHYDASANPKFQTTRAFLSRVVLVSRDDSVLIEEAPGAFAQTHGFRMLPHDQVAINPLVRFQVEQFVPKEGYTPSKAYMSRLLWRDLDGNQQSKLLLSLPEEVFAIVAGDTVAAEAPKPPSAKDQRRRSRGTRPAGLQAS